MRRGVTLIELLVATGIFVTGCTAIVALFTAGTRLRSQADTLVRCSLAAESLIQDIRLDAKGDVAPSLYVGDGFAANRREGASALVPYTASPGTWYVVESCTDAAGDDGNAKTATLHMNILILHKSIPETRITLTDLRTKELRWRKPPEVSDADADAWMRNELVSRGIALRMQAVIVPQPSWL